MADKKLTDAGIAAITTPTDDDLMYIVDAPGTVPASKKITWANIKATIKAYTDTLYAPIGGPGLDGWAAASGTWTYSSVDDPTGVLTVNADLTGVIAVGDRIKFTNGGSVIYGIVSKAPTYGAPNTTITFLHQIDPTDSLALVLMANSAITLPYYSHVKNPFGFPASPASWSVVMTDSTDRSQATPTATTVYNLGSLSIAIPIGAWNVTFSAQLWATSNAAQTSAGMHAGLSTANNTLATTALRGFAAQQGASGSLAAGASLCVSKLFTLATKTTYYCNAYTPFANCAAITFYNQTLAPLTVTCVCAYL